MPDAPPTLATQNVYSPPNGGFDSANRSYSGFAIPSDRRDYELRAANPLRCSLHSGDLITLVNSEGASAAWLIPFNPEARSSAQSLGIAPEASAIAGNANNTAIGTTSRQGQSGEVLLQPLENVSHLDQRRIYTWLDANGFSAARQLQGYRVFDEQSRAGELFTLRAREDLDLWLVIENNPQSLGAGGAGGAMQVSVKPAAASLKQQDYLPEPLDGYGYVREEFTVSRATASAYEVKAGEYVQIIDVEGQQCSDFMAMRHEPLGKGIERYIDSTVTRSMVGGAYPGPGLFDKFFDQDMKPIMRVMQDTVGRHDTFALACTARGYEERGFFGHINCSDNISHAYKKWGIAERRAWPAINFFFNSWILPHDNRIQSDEAWSQPGDYVAMQALTDLVCVTTACPDDIDPINGWNPTDIHVRIYKPEAQIRHAVAYRATPQSEAILTEHSAFHPRTSQLTEHYTVARDVWMPASFEATRAALEYEACRNAVTIQDMSSLRKFDILGPDAEDLLQLALTRNISKLALNRGIYALLCDESGCVVDDGTLFRLTPDTFRWCCGNDDSAYNMKKLAEKHKLNVWIKSMFNSMPNLAIQGPRSRELMKKIVFTQPHQPTVDTMKWFGSAIARLYDRDGVPFQLTRSGYTGELGYEIFCHTDAALPLWDALMEAGAEFGITPMGNEALEIIRIEAGLMAAGLEFGPDVDAFESGLGFAVDLNKENFTGKDALQRNTAEGATRRNLVGLKFDGDEVPLHGDGVYVDRRQVGVVTSATRSPALGSAIAMARVATEHQASGTRLEVGKLDGHKKRLYATVCEIPFVDPTRSRARS